MILEDNTKYMKNYEISYVSQLFYVSGRPVPKRF